MSAIGAAHGASRSRPYDRWFRYPAGCNGAVLEKCFRAVDAKPGDTVLDCFAGAATVGVHAARNEMRFVGLECHPLIAALGNLKFAKQTEEGSAENAAKSLVQRLAAVDVEDEHDLRGCFADDVLRDLIGLRDRDRRSSRSRLGSVVAMGTSGKSSRLSQRPSRVALSGPNRKRTPPYTDACRRFVQRAAMIDEDLAAHPIAGTGYVLTADARESSSFRAFPQADHCVGSPPYLNNFDYADATRLELYFLQDASTWAELCAHYRAGMVIATTQQSSVARHDSGRKKLEAFPQHATPSKR